MKKHQVSLSKKEKERLHSIIKKGRQSARTICRARILLLADAGKTDKEIQDSLSVSKWTPQNIRRRYAESTLDRALYDAPRPGQPKSTTTKEEAEITAIACTKPDDGYSRWTIDLLSRKVNERLKDRKKPIGRTTIHNILLRNELKPWSEKNVVHSGNDR